MNRRSRRAFSIFICRPYYSAYALHILEKKAHDSSTARRFRNRHDPMSISRRASPPYLQPQKRLPAMSKFEVFGTNSYQLFASL